MTRTRLTAFGRHVMLVVGLSIACANALTAQTGELSTTDAQRESVHVTAYNGGLALVHDRRTVTLSSGISQLAWRDVSAQIDATSAILESQTAPGSLSVVEQNFNYDLLSPAAMLAKSVGHQVTIVHDKSVRGEPNRETATILANNDGLVVRYRDRIETGLENSHIVYTEIPPNLRVDPTLVLTLDNRYAGPQLLDLSYLARGIAWHADYVGSVAPDEKSMTLAGLVTLENTSGTSFTDAALQLVAGNVNIAQEPTPGELRTIGRVYSVQAAALLREENYFEYHLYTLSRPTSIANNQTKQVALLTAHNVPLAKTLELRGSPFYYQSENADLGKKLPVGVYETFTNKDGELGVPLPGGIVRLYKNDSRGSALFLGSDRIDHTPRNEEVRLHLGDSFDVTANKLQTDFRSSPNGNCAFDSQYEIRIANAKTEPVDVQVVEPIPGTWSILNETLPHRKTSSGTATWTVHVPPDSKTTLKYGAHVDLCF